MFNLLNKSRRYSLFGIGNSPSELDVVFEHSVDFLASLDAMVLEVVFESSSVEATNAHRILLDVVCVMCKILPLIHLNLTQFVVTTKMLRNFSKYPILNFNMLNTIPLYAYICDHIIS